MFVYVDDLVLDGNNITEINSIKSFLDQTFKINDLGHLKYFLGLKISLSQVGIHICQRKYALDLLYDTCLIGVKTLSSLVQRNTRLHQYSSEPMAYPTPYRQLIYLTDTRPYISYSI